MNRPRFSPGKAQKTEYTVLSARLPEAFDGFKIAHISDPHSRPAPGTAEIIAGARPDITVITGDIVHDDGRDIGEIRALLIRLLEISPVYVITGNHDVWRSGGRKIFAEFQKLGAVLMDGTFTEIKKSGGGIGLFGIGDPFSKLSAVISEKVKSDLAALPGYDGFKILLFHRANMFDDIKNCGFDLILSGHMHGGQIILPHLGGILAPSSAMLTGKRMLFPKYCFGEIIHGETVMIINRGIGNTLPLPRCGNPPEVGIITLSKK